MCPIDPNDKLFETREARERFLSYLYALNRVGRHRELHEINQGLAMLHLVEVMAEKEGDCRVRR